MNSSGQQESYFSFGELFYSKTDQRGVILSGNSVFQRVSEFSWDELISKPHSVVRHPDMPRGVFHLLWENILAGRPLGAFVKNRSKSGKFYWVFALAMPVKDGFISVRLKPGGELLKIVETEYTALKQIEDREKLTPANSQAALLDRLRELGFSSYANFMGKALLGQIENRCRECGTPVPSAIKIMNNLQASCAAVIEKSQQVIESYHSSRFVPLNLEVNAARLGSEGSQIAVVANQYQKMAVEVSEQIGNFEKMTAQVSEQIEAGQLYIGASQLMSDARKAMIEESDASDSNDGGNAANDGISDINELTEKYLKLAMQGVQEINNVLTRFISACSALQMTSAGLELVRIAGKIESAGIREQTDIADLLNELKKFQVALSSGLREIIEFNLNMSQQAQELSQRLRTR